MSIETQVSFASVEFRGVLLAEENISPDALELAGLRTSTVHGVV